MKKFFCLLLSLIISISLVACSEKTEIPADSTDEAQSTTAPTEKNKKEKNKSLELNLDDGKLKYIGVEKANNALISHNSKIDMDKVVLLKFEYTNNQDEPSQCQNTFYIQVFQNGVENKSSLSYSGAGNEQYKLCSNYFLEVLSGATITFGRLVLVEDNSPLTIIAKERNKSDGEKQTMEVDISSVLSSSDETAGNNEDEKTNADNENKEKSESSRTLTAGELEAQLKEQELKITSTKYVVQDENNKFIYPDMLQVILKNDTIYDIKNAVIAFVGWDENNLPVKIKGRTDFSDGSYVTNVTTAI